ncbi:MAG: hypothetical protein FJY95_19245 [Candidatus Handelsmanbacteria bacterium]|nr:hypothetical protein [Candidatus Handelsmanbacteria bacterium]
MEGKNEDTRRGTGGGRSLIANLDDRGTFAVGATAQLTQTSAGVFTNTGAITLSAPDTLEVAVGTLTNQNEGTFTGGGMLMLDQVTLAGAGSIGALVEAYESAVNQAGIFRIEGSYYQDALSQVNIDLGGPEPGSSYDRLEVGGEAYINDGKPILRLVNGYEPGNCMAFAVLTFGFLNHRFDISTTMTWIWTGIRRCTPSKPMTRWTYGSATEATGSTWCPPSSPGRGRTQPVVPRLPGPRARRPGPGRPN